MQYQKIISGETTIEIHNSWLGEETVIVNGQTVSKKSSVWGTNHYFTVMENGHTARYILTTRVNEHMQVVLDLSRNGKLVEENVPIQFGSRPRELQNTAKKQGLIELQQYDLEEALKYFEEALIIAPKDPEIFFHMACAYSVMERTLDGFEALKKAVANGLIDHNSILTHDMLAYLRMRPAFEGFMDSGFKDYDERLIEENQAE